MQKADVPESLDERKFQLEKDKLALEIRKFECDGPKREQELRKLQEEIAELEKPWFRKSSYLGPLSTITVAVVGGMIAFGTDVFKSNVFKLNSERDQLKQSVAQLHMDEDGLVLNQQKLIQDKQRLFGDKTTLESQVGLLQKNVQSLGRQKDSLARDVRLTELRTRLQYIVNEEDTVGTADLQSIISLAKNDPDAIAVVVDSYKRSKDTNLMAALSYVLFHVTGDVQWKSSLKEFALKLLQSDFDYIHIGVSADALKDPSIFSIEERVETLKKLYSYFKAVPATEVEGRNRSLHRRLLLLSLVYWDTDASVKFRDPWFDLIGPVLKLEGQLGEDFGKSELAYIPQAYGILILRAQVGPEPPRFKDGDFVTDRILVAPKGDRCPMFPDSFPLCQDWYHHRQDWTDEDKRSFLRYSQPMTKGMQVWQASLPSYREWLKSNERVVSAWLDPSFAVLRSCSDSTMEKILKGEWIQQSDLQ